MVVVTKSEPYHSFRIEEQVVEDLAELERQLMSLAHRPSALKWVIISAHSALHGSFGVCLQRSDGAQLLTPKHEVATYKRWEQERLTGQLVPYGPAPVDAFLNLYDKVQDSARMSYLGGKPLLPTKSQTESVEHIHRLRGDLLHYSATTLIVDAREVLTSVGDVIDVIEFLLTDAQPFPLTLPELQDQAAVRIGEIRSTVGRMITSLS
jgi:hypothetical protein